ncbi:6-bladed beta-propeller [Parabacteroides bouchesdurhonensis]|uniref:6-bladed beta-propeller n=1 Tax=Parabacteroides bouchesdurhonensis TaxID=1936995 RepID=UPI00164DB6B7|nr:6-bladed beta-propeller [Parabacteroides bouchesdurhonensis]
MNKIASGNEYEIDFYSAYQKKLPILSVSQFAEDIEFIPLETNSNCLLDDYIRDIVITKDDILVFDYTMCYRFDKNGKFINSIGTRGQGPGEYVKARSMTVDTVNQWVYFSDNSTSRLVKYDYKGKYLSDFNVNISSASNCWYKPMEFMLKSDYYQFEEKGKRYSLFLFSEKEKKIISRMKCENNNKIPALAMCDPIVYKHNKETYLKDFWSDTIYHMCDPYHLESYAIFKKGKFVDRTRDDKSLISGKEDPMDKLVLDIPRISETDRYIFISSNRGNFIYDKKDQVTLAGGFKENKLGIEDDLYGSPGIRSDHFPGCANGNEFYTFRHAYEFFESGENKHLINDGRYVSYREMIKKLNSEGNPVIMVIKMKK